MPVGRSVWKLPLPLATSRPRSASFGPRISSLESVSVRLAVTKTTSSGASVLIGGCGCSGSAGSAWYFSGPTPICDGCTVIESLCDRDADPAGGEARSRFVGVLSAPQPSDASAERADARPNRALWLSRDPSRRNLAEREVDYLSRNAIFTYGELGARARPRGARSPGAIGPWAGETQALPTRPTSFSPRRSGVRRPRPGRSSRSPRRWRFGLPL